jgi:hypothetical protein
MKRRIYASSFCSYMHLFLIIARLYACEGFAIRENERLVVAHLYDPNRPIILDAMGLSWDHFSAFRQAWK